MNKLIVSGKRRMFWISRLVGILSVAVLLTTTLFNPTTSSALLLEDSALLDNPNSLVLHLTFDDNTANDSSTYGNNGTIYGATFVDSPIAGEGLSASFDGIDDYITIPDSDIWAFGIEDFTIAMWVKDDEIVNDTVYILSQNPITSIFDAVYYKIDPDGSVHYEIWQGNTNRFDIQSSPGEIIQGTWYHLVLVRNGDAWNIYKNGTSIASTFSSWAIPDWDTFTISAVNMAPTPAGIFGYFKGMLDEVKIYNVALSPAEIQAMYAAEMPDSGNEIPGWTFVSIPGLPAGASLGNMWTDRPGSLYVWAQVYSPDPKTAYLYRWNGLRWSQELVIPGYFDGRIYGSGTDDIFASVSYFDYPATYQKARMFHFDGTTWSEQILPLQVGAWIRSISGVLGEVQAVTYGYPNPDPNIIIRYDHDSETWNYFHTTPQNAAPLAFLSANEAYYTTCWGHGRWDGTTWSYKQEFDFCDIYDLWGIRDEQGGLHLYTVGSNNFLNGIRVWKYTENSDPSLMGTFGSKYGFVFGDPSYNSSIPGTARGVWGVDENEVYVVGQLGDWLEPGSGRIYHFDGITWQRISGLGDISAVMDVWGSGPNDVWFSLSDGRLLHFGELPPVPDLVAHYTFDNQNAVDLSEYGNHGVEHNGVTYVESPIGGVGYAASFDGANNYIEIPDDPSLRGMPQLSIEAWVYPTTVDPMWQGIVIRRDSYEAERDSYGLFIRRGWSLLLPHPTFYIYNDSSNDASVLCTGTVLETTQWVHLVGVYTGETAKLFVNGNLCGQVPFTGGNVADKVHRLLIGTFAYGGSQDYYFNGAVDEVRIYRKGLTQEEILANYNAEKPILNTAPEITIDYGEIANDEGNLAQNTGTVNDTDGDIVVLTASVGTVINNGDGTWLWSFLASDGPAQSQTVTITADDGRGGTDSASFELLVNNIAPTMTLSGVSSVDEGSLYSLNLSAVTDPGDDTINTCTLQWGDGQSDDCLGAIGGSMIHTYADGPNNYTISVDLTDEDGVYMNVDNLPVALDNVAPSVVNVSVPLAPININEQAINVSATFSDLSGLADEPYTCSIDYGDGKGSQVGTVNDATCTGYGYTYTESGVYAVTMTIIDKDGAGDSETAANFIVVYDPTGGFVTGGGWIWSPADAYIANPTLEGKATFGFVSKYLKGANVPTGNTEFQFKAGDLNFKSTSYQWLVVNKNGNNAQFKGYGTINGSGNYGFMIWATDSSPDTFRIKIWVADDETNVVYDNGTNQPIGDGSIVVHTK